MAQCKPYYATLEELETYLKSEGFEQQALKPFWKAEVNGNREDDCIVMVEGKAPAGYCIKIVQG